MSSADRPAYLPGGPGCPLVTGALPGIGGQILLDPDHFKVDEIPAYAPSGEGQHTLIRIQKRGLTTGSCVSILAEAMGVKARDIGSAGRKDRHAITTQWLSLPGPAPTLDHPDLEILEAHAHRGKLKMGHLRGNRFELIISGVDPEAAERLPALVAQISQGCPSYFGVQRFGRGNVERAFALLDAPRKRVRDPRFLASALQSAVFNHWLAARVRRGELNTALEGEVLRKRETGGIFSCEDAATDTDRMAAGEVDPFGPMIGPKMRAATGIAADYEGESVAAFDLDETRLAVLARFAPGARRVARIAPSQLRYEFLDPATLKVAFTLPKGAYATTILRELIHPEGPLRPSPFSPPQAP